MVFDARAATEQAEAQYPPFEFIGLDGGTYKLRHIALAPADDLTELGRLFENVESEEGADGELDGERVSTETMDMVMEIIARAAADEASGDAFRQLSIPVKGQLIAHWQAEFGTESGKSGRPSSATKKQGRPSKQTRKAAGKTSTRSKSGK